MSRSIGVFLFAGLAVAVACSSSKDPLPTPSFRSGGASGDGSVGSGGSAGGTAAMGGTGANSGAGGSSAGSGAGGMATAGTAGTAGSGDGGGAAFPSGGQAGAASGGTGGMPAGGASGAGGLATGGASTGGAAGRGTGGTAGTCFPSTTCTTADFIGTVQGDAGSDSVGAMGNTTRFVRVRVNETNTSPINGVPMRVTATMTPPAGSDYDLAAYLDPDTDQLACGMPLQVSEQLDSTPETIQLTWGEDAGNLPGSLDDSRDVVFEVIYFSGACGLAPEWSLTVSGNL